MNPKITDAEKRNREELFRLMREHPELPVIPMVNTEVVADDDYTWWMGSFGRVELAGYILAWDRVLIRGWDDDETVLDMLDEYIGWESWPDEKVDAAIKAFPWVECIMVHIVAGIGP